MISRKQSKQPKLPHESNPHVWYRYAAAYLSQADNAKRFSDGVPVEQRNFCNMSAHFLFGLAVELTLKAWLIAYTNGKYAPVVDGHNIHAIFEKATEHGLPEHLGLSQDMESIAKLFVDRVVIGRDNQGEIQRRVNPFRYPALELQAIPSGAITRVRRFLQQTLVLLAKRLDTQSSGRQSQFLSGLTFDSGAWELG